MPPLTMVRRDRLRYPRRRTMRAARSGNTTRTNVAASGTVAALAVSLPPPPLVTSPGQTDDGRPVAEPMYGAPSPPAAPPPSLVTLTWLMSEVADAITVASTV